MVMTFAVLELCLTSLLHVTERLLFVYN